MINIWNTSMVYVCQYCSLNHSTNFFDPPLLSESSSVIGQKWKDLTMKERKMSADEVWDGGRD